MKAKRTLCWGIAAFMLAACQNDTVMDAVENATVPLEEQETAYTTKVTEDDATRVATLFGAGSADTRSERTIKEVKAIADEEGNPAIYVVNYADNKGYVLVSATKNYLPVLAYNDVGNFEIPEESANGIGWWMEKTKGEVKLANQLPADSTARFRAEWSEYEVRKPFAPMTRSDRELDPYAVALTGEWQKNGVTWYSLQDADDVLPASQYQYWCELAQGAMAPEFLDEYDYRTYSFVMVQNTDTGSGFVDNFVHTKWHQTGGYNDSILILGQECYAGCTTIAMAQIMRYHEYPTTENWADMPYTYSTPTTAKFIKEVAASIDPVYGIEGFHDGTSATIEDVRSAFKKYGYSSDIKIIDHNSTLAKNELDNGRPVYMRGDSDDNAGHGWVAGGYRFTRNRTEYLLYVPVQNCSSGAPYVNIETYLASEVNWPYFYMVWGWADENDGWYNDYELNPASYSFDDDRRDIIYIQKP